MKRSKVFIVSVVVMMLFQSGVVSARIISYYLSNKQPGAMADPKAVPPKGESLQPVESKMNRSMGDIII